MLSNQMLLNEIFVDFFISLIFKNHFTKENDFDTLIYKNTYINIVLSNETVWESLVAEQYIFKN